MNIRTTLAIAALAIMGSTAAMAQSASTSMPLTRAEVRQSVIDARNAGELISIGESDDYPQVHGVMPSTLASSTVHARVIAALASGSLTDVGDGDGAAAERATVTASSPLTRADVKLATLQARDSGELILAGDGDASELIRDRAQQQYARTAWLARKSMPVVASN